MLNDFIRSLADVLRKREGIQTSDEYEQDQIKRARETEKFGMDQKLHASQLKSQDVARSMGRAQTADLEEKARQAKADRDALTALGYDPAHVLKMKMDAEAAKAKSEERLRDAQTASANATATLHTKEAEYPELYHPRTQPNTAARGDRSYTWATKQLDDLGKSSVQTAERLDRLRATIAQNSPQADALVAPELLTVMAGGQGSGLRMNEAEISRLIGGRSHWESLKAAAQQWSTDPASANTITPDQRAQIHKLVEEVAKRLQGRLQSLDQAHESLLNSDDPAEHRRVVQAAKHSFMQDTLQTPAGGTQKRVKLNPLTGELE